MGGCGFGWLSASNLAINACRNKEPTECEVHKESTVDDCLTKDGEVQFGLVFRIFAFNDFLPVAETPAPGSPRNPANFLQAPGLDVVDVTATLVVAVVAGVVDDRVL